MRVIILADGPAKRWNHLVPKHLITLRGEVLLHRTLRQVMSRGITDVWITSHDPRYAVSGAIRFEPEDNRFQIDQFYACRLLWHPCDNTPVVFLYGDVWFSDAAIDVILGASTAEYLYFQRTGASKITGKKWKEGFAMKVADTKAFHSALAALRTELVEGKVVDEHHQLQGYLEGFGMGPYWDIGPHGIEIYDETEDFDFPEDISVWLDHTSGNPVLIQTPETREDP